MPIELGFILKRLAEMAEADELLRGKQPWKAARERDYRWLSEVITKHYHGDDGDVRVLMGRSSRCGSGAASGAGPGGNSNGAIPMLRYAGGPSRPALRLLVLHDDGEREFDYVAGAEKSLEQAAAGDWTVVSMKRDWSAVFTDPG